MLEVEQEGHFEHEQPSEQQAFEQRELLVERQVPFSQQEQPSELVQQPWFEVGHEWCSSCRFWVRRQHQRRSRQERAVAGWPWMGRG